jgi:hypothetical protein
LNTIINYALQQNLIARKIDIDELFDDAARGLRGCPDRAGSQAQRAPVSYLTSMG